MNPDPHRYSLTEAEHDRIFHTRIKPLMFDGHQPTERPTAAIFGGQPGAGKSAVVDYAVQQLKARGGAVQIIGDDLRAFHPAYAKLMAKDDTTAAFYTDRDTGRWVEKAIEHATTTRYNVVIEGTMRDAGKVAQTMQMFRAAGYEVDARVLAVNDKLSWQGILQRYENQKLDRGTGRMTTPEAHQAGYDGLPKTVERIEGEKLADRITVYRRGAEVVYANALERGEWMKSPGARAAIEAERARPFTLEEQRAYVAGYDKLFSMVTAPERRASKEEIAAVGQLRDAAHAAFTPAKENAYTKGRAGAAPGAAQELQAADSAAHKPRTLK